jgi:esterase/lipase
MKVMNNRSLYTHKKQKNKLSIRKMKEALSQNDEQGPIEDFQVPPPNKINKEREEEEKKQSEQDDPDNERIMLYFHGNSEDVGSNVYFLMQLREMFEISTLAMEYPGYGIFTHSIVKGVTTEEKLTCSAKSITTNAELVIKHLLKSKKDGGLGYKSKNILIFGRSIGTGPATYLASRFKVGALIIMSPYTNIKGVAANVAGKFASFFISSHFDNAAAMKSVRCPVILLHGKQDTLIPSTHSEALWKILHEQRNNKNFLGFSHIDRSEIYLHPRMTHNEFHLMNDILKPI